MYFDSDTSQLLMILNFNLFKLKLKADSFLGILANLLKWLIGAGIIEFLRFSVFNILSVN